MTQGRADFMIDLHELWLRRGVNPSSPEFMFRIEDAVGLFDTCQHTHKIEEAKAVGTYIGSRKDKDVLGVADNWLGSKYVRAKRQRDTTKYKKQVETTLRKAEKELKSIVSSFRRGAITASALNRKSADVFKKGYTNIYELGLKASGIEQALRHSGQLMSKEDKAYVKSAYEEELKYWKKLLKELVRDKERRVEHRITNYVRTMGSLFEAGRVVAIPPNVVIHWMLEDKTACEDCKELHRNSPFTKSSLPTQPKSGVTRCRMNCRCRLAFKEATSKEVARIEAKQKRPSMLLKKMKQSQKRK